MLNPCVSPLLPPIKKRRLIHTSWGNPAVTDLTTKIFAANDMPADLCKLYALWDMACFTEPNPFDWAQPQWHVMVYAEGEPVSHVGVIRRDCTMDGQPFPLSGICSVMTPEVHRKKGYAVIGMQRAHDFMREELDAPFSLLVTKPYLIAYYTRLGWQHVTTPMIVDLPDGSKFTWEEVIMVLPFTDMPWPTGTLDLCGWPW